MKAFLIVVVILALLWIAIFLLIRKPGKVIDDVVTKQDDEKSQPNVENDVLKYSGSSIQTDEIKNEEEEVHIPEHCKIEKNDEVLPNKYFFNIHKYTSSRGKQMYCVVCSAIINNENYRIIVKNSYYPYLGSYTITLMNKIESMFEDDKMSIEEFRKLGSINFTNVGEIVTNF